MPPEIPRTPHATAVPSPFEKLQEQYIAGRLRDEQDMGQGLVACSVAALLGAAGWAALTVLTGYKIDMMALGVGYLVGYAMRFFGKGMDQIFGIVSAIFALAGCVLGNLLAACSLLALKQGTPLLEELTRLDLEQAIALLTQSFHPLDIVFYGMAIYTAYQQAFRVVSEEEKRRALALPPLIR